MLAEDEPSLAQIIKESLETRNFDVTICNNGQEAFESYSREKPEILVLDVMMPTIDGFTLAKKIRQTDSKTPIIFLTAKSQTQDVVDGFQNGGNDYLKKPFSMEELIVRIHSLLERVKLKEETAIIHIGVNTFDRTKQILTYNNNSIALTHRESELLYYLYESRNTILDRSLILNKLWGNDDFFTTRSMDVFITKLRKKLNHDPSIQILNIRNQGYKLIC